MTERLSLKTCIGFSVGTVGVSIMLNAVTAYYPAFMSTVMGQSPEISGFLLMASKLFDALIDVAVGTLSDRTRSRWGRRKPWLLAGGILSAASFLMIFSPPELSQGAVMAYMVAALLLYSLAYSLFNVPYMALPAELTDGFHDRTRLLSWRTLFVSIGQLLSMAGTAALIERGGGGAAGYATMGLVMALIIGGAMTATALAVPVTGNAPPRAGKHMPTLGQLRAIVANRPYMMLLGAKVFQFLAFASIASCGVLYLLNVLEVGYRGQIVLAVTQNVVQALSLPLWVRLGRQKGKRFAYLCGVVLFCLGALSWLTATRDITTMGIVARGLLSGAGSGAIILMSISMLGDTLAYDRFITGEGREGLLSSTVAVIEKTSFALGVAVLGLFLKAFHYVPTFGGKIVEQPESAVLALKLGFAVIPAAIYAINAFFILRYDLDEAKLDEAKRAAEDRFGSGDAG
ncbi:MFS transporter [Novosphingobium aquae]|uniref:MFS transporter n=1 Tax=Novosphingobium aquae TaxID=3133435 RepID=A0ABU8S755_9SPHN